MKDMVSLAGIGLAEVLFIYLLDGGVFVALPDLCHLVGIVDRLGALHPYVGVVVDVGALDGHPAAQHSEGEGLYFCPIAFYMLLSFVF